MKDWFFKHIWLPVYGKWALAYVRRSRSFRFGKLLFEIPTGVFHPGLYFSSPLFARFISRLPIKGRRVLDVGTGSGLLALVAAEAGATVTALDIHPDAVAAARHNAHLNRLEVEVVESDLFSQLPPDARFDIILVNPPYFAAHPANLTEHAFFAGKNLEYFQHLFQQLPTFLSSKASIWMILSDDCNLGRITGTAEAAGFSHDVAVWAKKWGKKLIIYHFQLKASTNQNSIP